MLFSFRALLVFTAEWQPVLGFLYSLKAAVPMAGYFPAEKCTSPCFPLSGLIPSQVIVTALNMSKPLHLSTYLNLIIKL